MLDAALVLQVYLLCCVSAVSAYLLTPAVLRGIIIVALSSTYARARLDKTRLALAAACETKPPAHRFNGMAYGGYGHGVCLDPLMAYMTGSRM